MRTKEQILIELEDAMPFDLSENIKPYIMEAMNIYAKQYAIPWVSVEDDLPPYEQKVLALIKNDGKIIMGFAKRMSTDKNGERWWFHCEDDTLNAHIREVFAWQKIEMFKPEENV